MQYLYNVAGIRLLCESPFPIQVRKESSDFFTPFPPDCTADLKFIFCPAESLGTMPAGGHWEINRYYFEDVKNQYIYYCPTRELPPYARVIWSENSGETVNCDYIYGKESYMNYSHNLCDLIGLETLLLKYNGLLLHSSFIRWKEKGILFSAPSGTGKSTQADLWVKYEGSEILNGDRVGLRYLDQHWTAFGLPLAGSSYIYRNTSASVAAIITLEQSPENKIRKLNPIEAFHRLFPETTVHHWHKYSEEKAVSLLINLISNIPVYLLKCRPDKGLFKSSKIH